MLSVLINGICGQMGRAVYSACQAQSEAFLVAAGVDPREETQTFACPVYRTLNEVKENVDVLIDFSVPATLPAVLRYAQSRGVAAVIGTTGLGEREHKLLRAASEHIAVFQTRNMSFGVNLQLELVKQAAAALGSYFDAEIIESHHRMKVDSPSGTALMLAEAIAEQRSSESEFSFGRHERNKRRTQSEIGIHAVRGGTLVGEHDVQFIGNDEIVEIRHRAFSKQVFAQGALRASQYVAERKNGLYNMKDVVTEHDVASRLFALDGQAIVIAGAGKSDDSFMMRLFDKIASHNVYLDMIACTSFGTRESSVGFSLPASQLSEAVAAVNELRSSDETLSVQTRSGQTKLTLEGSGMALRHGVAAKLLSVLNKVDVVVHLITTSETKIEFCVDAVDTQKAVEEIRTHFVIE